MHGSHKIALDTEADVAHAFVDGESLTLCEQPIATYQLEASSRGVGRTVSVCVDCRGAYAPVQGSTVDA